MTHGKPDHPEPRNAGSAASAALRAAARGWAVFPVRPRGKTPAVRDWDNAATTDPDRILSWWSRVPWNIGLATGRSGLLVLDLDIPTLPPGPSSARTGAVGQLSDIAEDDVGWHPTNGAGAGRGACRVSGLTVLRSLVAEARAAPPWGTFTVRTPSGGRHLYFRQPDDTGLRNTQGALGPLIDSRGYGGYVLAAGSHGPADRRYRVLRDGPVAPLPTWLHHALTAPHAPMSTRALSGGPCIWSGRDVNPDNARRGNRTVPVVSAARIEAYLRAVVDGETRAVSAAPVGARHTTLLGAARRLGHWVGGRVLDQADARAALTAAAHGYIGVAGYTARQVDRDITDGLAYGASRPRHIDDLSDRSARQATDAYGQRPPA